MTSEKYNILITSAGRRVQLVRFFQQALSKCGVSGCVLAMDLNPEWSSAARVADARFVSPRATDGDYGAFLLELVQREHIRLIIPTIDTDLLPLAGLSAALRDLKCEVVISDAELIAVCRDKHRTNDWFHAMGFETPRILNRCHLVYPCFVKPRDGSGSVGACAVLSPQMLSAHTLEDDNLLFMTYCDPQEYDEYTVDVYYDRNGKMTCLVPRKRIEVRAGEISKGIALKGKTYEYLWTRLQSVPGARGCLTYQFFVTKGEDRWLGSELNARFGGGYPLTHAAGANFPQWLVREYLLGEQIPVFEGWRDRTAMVRYDSEIIFNLDDPT